ncbi:MAG: hypothetical protein GY943_19845, partial [Chloroflexi bacterium]|nr:hypothetical protein [Chloroflexota bacterium]
MLADFKDRLVDEGLLATLDEEGAEIADTNWASVHDMAVTAMGNMNNKVDNALNRLQRVLPLKERQSNCSEEIRQLHQQILRSFVTKGRILTREEMAQQVSNLDEAVNVLRSNDMVTFSADGKPVGAYPFTMEEREHTIQVNGHQVHAMCALDALAVSPMFGMNTEIRSRCRVTGEPVHIQQSSQTIENINEAGGVYFGIVWGAADGGSC